MLKIIAVETINLLIEGVKKDKLDKTYSVAEIIIWLEDSKNQFLK